ncbi:MAG: M56 family metallopeptidase, partial [Actinobacteria bacterium]|nr:M56 family metallopeptidase [Actinomycetota bacterium]
GPTILSLEPDSAWVVIFVVSVVTYLAALLLRKLIGKPGGLASGIFLALPLVLPLLAAGVYAGSALPEVGVLQPAGRAVTEQSGELLHLLLLADANSGVVTPYALSGTAGSWLLAFGVAVSSFMLLRRAIGTITIHRLLRRCEPLPDVVRERIAITVSRLARGTSLKKAPEVLLLPPGVPGAFASGTRKRRILIARELLVTLDPAELDAILAHEVAHLEARDCQVMFGAGFLRDLVAWNPVAHLAYHHLVTDRELEADRRAASLTGKPLAVASSLLKMCEMVRDSKFKHRAVVAFMKPGSRINRRVTNLLALADAGSVVGPPRRLPYVAAAVLLAVVGLEAGERIATEDASGLAIMWGAPAESDGDGGREMYRRLKQPRATKGADDVKPRYYSRLASQSFVRDRDLDNWIRAMTRWASAQDRALVRLRWESRQDWRAVPLFSETVGPFDIYTVQRQPL